MLAKAEGRRTVPQIFINDTPIGGYDDLHALDAAGVNWNLSYNKLRPGVGKATNLGIIMRLRNNPGSLKCFAVPFHR